MWNLSSKFKEKIPKNLTMLLPTGKQDGKDIFKDFAIGIR